MKESLLRKGRSHRYNMGRYNMGTTRVFGFLKNYLQTRVGLWWERNLLNLLSTMTETFPNTFGWRHSLFRCRWFWWGSPHACLSRFLQAPSLFPPHLLGGRTGTPSGSVFISTSSSRALLWTGANLKKHDTKKRKEGKMWVIQFHLNDTYRSAQRTNCSMLSRDDHASERVTARGKQF